MVIVSFVDAKFQGCGQTVEQGGGSLVNMADRSGRRPAFLVEEEQILFTDPTSWENRFSLDSSRSMS